MSYYYVTIIRSPRQVCFAAGPFHSEELARRRIEDVRHEAQKVDPFTAFDAFGTARREGPPLEGKLNHKIGMELA